ncbi:MAG: hypothetical protein HZA34_03630 [Candidatus Pacebacteria bacterium]|nr:hypothetical protein [Candidatus Paceibacterota bacterium]
MDPLVLTLTIVSSVLAVFLIALGVQAFLVLRETRKTLQRVNGIIDVAEHTVVRALVPLSSLGGFVTGMKSGMKVFEHFVQYVKKVADEE